jgi:hypothetical protein
MEDLYRNVVTVGVIGNYGLKGGRGEGGGGEIRKITDHQKMNILTVYAHFSYEKSFFGNGKKLDLRL